MLRPGPFPETRLSLLASLQGDAAPKDDWRRFFEMYAPSVFRIARRAGLAAPDADDIVQQVMVAITAHIGRFDPLAQRGRFRHWIRTITTNKVSDLYRRRAAHPASPLDQAADAPTAQQEMAAAWDQEWYLQDLQQCLCQVQTEIAPRSWTAFRLYALQNVSAEETARQLGMTRAHVYVIRSEVIRRLRALFDQLRAHETES